MYLARGLVSSADIGIGLHSFHWLHRRVCVDPPTTTRMWSSSSTKTRTRCAFDSETSSAVCWIGSVKILASKMILAFGVSRIDFTAHDK